MTRRQEMEIPQNEDDFEWIEEVDDDDDAVPIVDVPSFDSIEESAGDTMQTDELSNSNTDANVTAECDDVLADSVMPQDEQSARDVEESLASSHRDDDSVLVTTEALTAADILVDDAEPLSRDECDVTVAPPPPAVTSESPALVSTAGQAHEGGALPSVLSLK